MMRGVCASRNVRRRPNLVENACVIIPAFTAKRPKNRRIAGPGSHEELSDLSNNLSY